MHKLVVRKALSKRTRTAATTAGVMSAQADAGTVQESTVTARGATAPRALTGAVRGRASPLLGQSTTKMTGASRKKGAVDMTEEGPAPGHPGHPLTDVTPKDVETIVEAEAGQPQRTQGSIVAGTKKTTIGTERLTKSVVKESPHLAKGSGAARVSHLLTRRRRESIKRRVFRCMTTVVLSSLQSNCLKSRTEKLRLKMSDKHKTSD